MDKTWQSILDDFVNTRQKTYPNENAQKDALIEAMAYTLQSILEKLRDTEAASE